MFSTSSDDSSAELFYISIKMVARILYCLDERRAPAADEHFERVVRP